MPSWAARLRFAEQFKISPAEVDKLPAIWWLRWSRHEHAKALRAARDFVDCYGLSKADPDTHRLYSELVAYGRDTNRS